LEVGTKTTPTIARHRERTNSRWGRRSTHQEKPSTLGLNIKNERITELVRELANRTGTTQTGAIEEAVRSKLAELDREAADVTDRRESKRAIARRLLAELHGSLTAAERKRMKAAEKQLYDDAGLPT
jgi:antitoxin VapB